MREPPITLTCDCGRGRVRPLRRALDVPDLRQDVGHGADPAEEYAKLVASVRRYRLLALGPPLVLAAILIPLAIVSGSSSGSCSSCSCFAYAVFVMPKVRERATEAMRQSTRSWELVPE